MPNLSLTRKLLQKILIVRQDLPEREKIIRELKGLRDRTSKQDNETLERAISLLEAESEEIEITATKFKGTYANPQVELAFRANLIYKIHRKEAYVPTPKVLDMDRTAV